jgi:hypothetical protein
MDVSSYMPSLTFIKVDDVRNDGPFTDVVLRVDEGRFNRLHVTFESGRILSINGTNLKTLVGHFGRETDAWIGKQLQLSIGKVNFEGVPVDAILVTPISEPIPPDQRPKPVPTPPRPMREQARSDLDDDIPF